jgi:8-oxo-dGTP diphosphatase
MSIGHFLAGIAALIYDPQSQRYLLMRRSAQKDFAAGDWECVTGRVDQGESFEQALHREVWEETGARVQIETLLGTTHFYRGAERAENELLGVLYGCTAENSSEFTFEAEHSEMRWVTADEATALLPEGFWLRRLIQRAEMVRCLLPEELGEFFRQQGFEI